MTIEKEYIKIERALEELDNTEEEEVFDNLSSVDCNCCGNRLSVDEWQEFEDMCEECMFESTSGLIDYRTEEEL